MDHAVPPGTPLTWVFTLGYPNPDVLEQLSGLASSGYLNWVVIPIHADIESLRESGWQLASASS